MFTLLWHSLRRTWTEGTEEGPVRKDDLWIGPWSVLSRKGVMLLEGVCSYWFERVLFLSSILCFQPIVLKQLWQFLKNVSQRMAQISIVFSGGSKGERKGRAPLPPRPNFFHFHAVFGKNWANSMLAPPPLGWRTPLWEILDPPLVFNKELTVW